MVGKIYSVKQFGWDYKGYYLQNKVELCAVWYSDPNSVYYQLINIPKYDPQSKDSRYDFYEEDNSIYFEFPLEDSHFFALRKEEQLDILKRFISACHAEAKRLRK